MTTGISSGTANTILDANFDDQWLQIHTGDPGAAGTANVSVGETDRFQYTTAAASAGSKSYTAVGPFVNAGTSETITHVSIWSASTAGTFKGSYPLAASKAWASGDTLTLDGSVAFTPIAA